MRKYWKIQNRKYRYWKILFYWKIRTENIDFGKCRNTGNYQQEKTILENTISLYWKKCQWKLSGKYQAEKTSGKYQTEKEHFGKYRKPARGKFHVGFLRVEIISRSGMEKFRIKNAGKLLTDGKIHANMFSTVKHLRNTRREKYNDYN